jgi:hypothetical protein
MPLTKLDAVTALVVIDLQLGMVGLPTIHAFARDRRPGRPARPCVPSP